MRASKRFQSIKDNKSYCYNVFKVFTFLFDPLTINDELSRHENLTFLWTWYLEASRPMLLCAIICPLINCPKTVKILAVKGLILLFFFFNIINYIYIMLIKKAVKRKREEIHIAISQLVK